MNYLLRYLTVGVGVLLLGFAIRKFKNRKEERPNESISFPIKVSDGEVETLEILTLEQVIFWFKAQLEESNSGQAILLKISDGSQISDKQIFDFKQANQDLFIQGFFDAETKNFFKMRFLLTDQIGEDLQTQLENNDMIVFE